MIYFDNSATTKPHTDVLDTFIKVNEQFYANPASIHAAGTQANLLLDRARNQVAQIFNTDEKCVIFTAGGTESNNLAIFGIPKANTHKGKHIITTEIEHASILEACKSLEKEGFEVDYLHVDESGVISLDELKEKIRKDTVLVSIMHVNNEIGAIQPIEEAGQIIHEQSRAVFHVDAVQSFGKVPISFNGEKGPDIITISGHKIHALKGSGAIVFRNKLNIIPLILGGGQEFGLRSGTVAVPQAVALAKAARMAIENLQASNEKYRRWQKDLFKFLTGFGEHIHILSTESGAPHILSFSVKDLKGEILINALQERGIIVSTSSACSSKLQKTSHVVTAIKLNSKFKNGVIRLSFGAFNTDEEIQKFKDEFTKVMIDLTSFRPLL
ncbi:Cysteine desulfurase OS=Ureibacillus acetophenoni OX=614649 GN=SAMN05877842_102518 PE=4 SV=1 [Ureibacillus acetophenoni]